MVKDWKGKGGWHCGAVLQAFWSGAGGEIDGEDHVRKLAWGN